jgi:hypothetical protein
VCGCITGLYKVAKREEEGKKGSVKWKYYNEMLWKENVMLSSLKFLITVLTEFYVVRATGIYLWHNCYYKI